jgi:hypothetical protein
MAKNKLSDLRDHLFATLEALTDEKKPMELDRARAIAKVSQTIIESAKVEVQFMKEMGAQTESTFFNSAPQLPKPAPPTVLQIEKK